MKLYFENIPLVLIPMLPNILWMIFPPRGMPERAAVKSAVTMVLEVIEKAGQIGAFILPVFWQVSLSGSVKAFCLFSMALFAAFYYAGWVRYFAGGRRYRLLFMPMLKVPLPMAVSPILYFFALSWLLQSPVMLCAVVLLCIGHMAVSWREWARLRAICAKEGGEGK